ncbi:MAG: hypothetical protein AVDCRST_MAG22-2350 [uncultured Rubrobacteraceae bacterium]|uniref:Uncharacterized protein n=1 Tax=uncultured Rubrobacteraceae bacterium TaxID=349277 RepID=A0A6J4PMA2_9ACTN|nr:MAG: hypothetical protein AVDCRST_MAG22-2350 [uncultured Rubrobacteraceae bacterium]
MSITLTVVGVALLLICLAGIALGVYMAFEHKNREAGTLFALCWVSGAAGAAGVAMRDSVTFLVGMVCFLVAGAVYLLFGDVRTGAGRRERGQPSGGAPEGSEETTKENRSGHSRAVS